MSKHHKSVFDNEQDLLKALIEIHCPWGIELDPMYFKGNFYKDGVEKPACRFDLNPQVPGVEQGDASDLPYVEGTFNSMILDPPFLFGIHGKTKNYYSSKTHTIFKDFAELEACYRDILEEAKRLLNSKGVLIFKCQDYTDSKTTMTHSLVYNWATELGFYAKDIAILVKPNKVYNGNTTQRHLRKIHTYFWVFTPANKRRTK
jgi:DNA modification methylase